MDVVSNETGAEQAAATAAAAAAAASDSGMGDAMRPIRGGRARGGAPTRDDHDDDVKEAPAADAAAGTARGAELPPPTRREGARVRDTPSDTSPARGGIQYQPTVNIGLVGHVAHGKSSTCRALSTKRTQHYKEEITSNKTIKLGYSNCKIYRCNDDACAPPACFQAGRGTATKTPKCRTCRGPTHLVRHISFVDCPGHEALMATMLNGACVMDAAVLLVAANEPCPQPQTAEHLGVMNVMRVPNMVVVQNKCELVSPQEAEAGLDAIAACVAGTAAQDAPVIPMSAQLGLNIDALAAALAAIPIPSEPAPTTGATTPTVPTRMLIVRSFDVNKPGTRPLDLVGGVAGGSVVQGTLRVGQEVEIRPGFVRRDPATGRFISYPLRTRVTRLESDNQRLDYALRGGLVGVGTTLDPSRSGRDRLVGHVLGDVGTLPDVYAALDLRVKMLRRVPGADMTLGRKQAAAGPGAVRIGAGAGAGAGVGAGTALPAATSSGLARSRWAREVEGSRGPSTGSSSGHKKGKGKAKARVKSKSKGKGKADPVAAAKAARDEAAELVEASRGGRGSKLGKRGRKKLRAARAALEAAEAAYQSALAAGTGAGAASRARKVSTPDEADEDEEALEGVAITTVVSAPAPGASAATAPEGPASSPGLPADIIRPFAGISDGPGSGSGSGSGSGASSGGELPAPDPAVAHAAAEAEAEAAALAAAASAGKRARRFKDGEQVRLHVNARHTTATVRRASSSRAAPLRFELKTPVCLDLGERVAISRKVGDQWRLVAYGDMRGGDVVQTMYPKRSRAGAGAAGVGAAAAAPAAVHAVAAAPKAAQPPDVPGEHAAVASNAPTASVTPAQRQAMHGRLLARLHDAIARDNDALTRRTKIKLPPLQVFGDGPKRTIWANFLDLCKAIARDPKHVLAFIAAELQVSAVLDGQNRLALSGHWKPAKLGSMFRNYRRQFVLCPQCHRGNTTLELSAKHRVHLLVCKDCKATSAATSIEKGYRAVQRGERRAARRAGGQGR